MVKVIAHRGDSVHAPENTMLAFKSAVESGADGIELDIHLSKDGYMMVRHDPTVNTPYGKALIRDMTFAELRQLDMGAGQKMPTLTEALALVENKDCLLNIEIKRDPIAPYDNIEQKLVDEVKRFDMIDKVIISSFDHQSLQRLKLIEPAIQIGLLYQSIMAEPWWMALRLKARSLHPFYAGITPSLVEGCNYYNIELYPWTVDDPTLMGRLIDMGVTGIITNDPKTLLSIRSNKEY